MLGNYSKTKSGKLSFAISKILPREKIENDKIISK